MTVAPVVSESTESVTWIVLPTAVVAGLKPGTSVSSGTKSSLVKVSLGGGGDSSPLPLSQPARASVRASVNSNAGRSPRPARRIAWFMVVSAVGVARGSRQPALPDSQVHGDRRPRAGQARRPGKPTPALCSTWGWAA